METFTEEQKIAATARLVQDLLAHALEVLPSLPTAASTATGTGAYSAGGDGAAGAASGSAGGAGGGEEGGLGGPVAPLEEALEDALLILQVRPLLAV